MFLYFFFFQAEDGIRDGRVTGVQTCALPICRGIRVNAVAPGYFASEMTDTLPPGELEHVQLSADLQRIGQQHELDAAVLFLASDAASYITGATLAVDGGMTGH